MSATVKGRTRRQTTISDLVTRVLDRYPDADDTEIDLLTSEVESEITASARTILACIALFRPVLRHSIAESIREMTRQVEDEVVPRKRRRRRRRTSRRRPAVAGSQDGYERPSIPELRELLAVEGLDRLLRRTFIPSRGEPPVTYEEATGEQHRQKAEAQYLLAESNAENGDLHMLFYDAITATEGAENFTDVKRAWNI